MRSFSPTTINASRYGRAPLLLAFMLVWSILVSAGHQHFDEPHGMHGDCLYCHYLHDGGVALPLAAQSSVRALSLPAPETVAAADHSTIALWPFQARAPPAFL